VFALIPAPVQRIKVTCFLFFAAYEQSHPKITTLTLPSATEGLGQTFRGELHKRATMHEDGEKTVHSTTSVKTAETYMLHRSLLGQRCVRFRELATSKTLKLGNMTRTKHAERTHKMRRTRPHSHSTPGVPPKPETGIQAVNGTKIQPEATILWQGNMLGTVTKRPRAQQLRRI